MQPFRHGQLPSRQAPNHGEALKTYQEEETYPKIMEHHQYGQHDHAALSSATDDPTARRQHQFQHHYDTVGSSPPLPDSERPYEGVFQSVETPRALQQPETDFGRANYSERNYAPEEDTVLPNSPYNANSQPYVDTHRPLGAENMDEDLVVKDSFIPPASFPRDQCHHQAAYSAYQGSHAWQQHAYAGQHSLHQQQQQDYYYYQQEQIPYPQRDHDDAAQWESVYQNPNERAHPGWPASGGYQVGAPSWPYGPPPYPSDALNAEQYYPPHQYGYPQYGIQDGFPRSYRRPPNTAAQYHVSVPGVAAASQPANHLSSLSSRQLKDEAIKQKKPPPKKDPDKPKRPLSAYNLFFRDERARMLAELDTSEGKSSSKGDGKPKATNGGEEPKSRRKKAVHGLGFKPMAQRVAARWKALDEGSLSVYEKMASKDLERYKQEMKEYRDRQTNKTGQANPP